MVHVLRFRSYFIYVYVFWMDLHFMSATLLGQMQNVALNKGTYQVSTLFGGVSSRANDGNTNQDYNGASCTHTDVEWNPFWQVDLSDVYVVDSVRIYNRLDMTSEYTSNVETAVSFDGYNFTRACYHEGQIPDVYTCEPGTRVVGRFVKITALGDEQIPMNICEVEVMSDQTVARDLFRSRPFIQGTGDVMETKRIVSHIHCLCYCLRTTYCVAANVVNVNNNFTSEIVNSPNMECQLLGYVSGQTVMYNTVLWVLNL